MRHYFTDSNHHFNERVANSENNGQRFLRVLFSPAGRRQRRERGIYGKRMEAEN